MKRNHPADEYSTRMANLESKYLHILEADCGKSSRVDSLSGLCKCGGKIATYHRSGGAINPFVLATVCRDPINFPQTINLIDLSTASNENMPLCYLNKTPAIPSTAGVLRDKIGNFLWENNFVSPLFVLSLCSRCHIDFRLARD